MRRKPIRQVQVTDQPTKKVAITTTDPLNYLLSDTEDEDNVLRANLRDQGSNPKGVKVNIQGVLAIGLVDSGADITIMGALLFLKVAMVAHLRKRDLKTADKVPKPIISAHLCFTDG